MNVNNSLKDIINFYDQFINYQKKTGLNIRIKKIFRNLRNEGLKSNSTILEIGCGIGILSRLLGKYAKNGKVISVDISPESIKIARQRNKNLSNINFIASDILKLNFDTKFDFIILPDVLEHIPIKDHNLLFKKISQSIHSSGKVAINIPSPYHIQWQEKFEVEKLQIIDQPLHTNMLLHAIYQNDLYLYKLDSYSLFFNQADYEWIVLKHFENINSFTKKSKGALRLQELKSRLY